MNFKREMAIKRARERMEERRAVKVVKRATARVLIGAAIVAGAYLCAGAYNGPQRLVEDTYTVRPGDTLWHIGETYLARNTGGRRYILEFISGIREINPELQRTSEIYPGQVIRVNYWVKGE